MLEKTLQRRRFSLKQNHMVWAILVGPGMEMVQVLKHLILWEIGMVVRRPPGVACFLLDLGSAQASRTVSCLIINQA